METAEPKRRKIEHNEPVASKGLHPSPKWEPTTLHARVGGHPNKGLSFSERLQQNLDLYAQKQATVNGLTGPGNNVSLIGFTRNDEGVGISEADVYVEDIPRGTEVYFVHRKGEIDKIYFLDLDPSFLVLNKTKEWEKERWRKSTEKPKFHIESMLANCQTKEGDIILVHLGAIFFTPEDAWTAEQNLRRCEDFSFPLKMLDEFNGESTKSEFDGMERRASEFKGKSYRLTILVSKAETDKEGSVEVTKLPAGTEVVIIFGPATHPTVGEIVYYPRMTQNMLGSEPESLRRINGICDILNLNVVVRFKETGETGTVCLSHIFCSSHILCKSESDQNGETRNTNAAGILQENMDKCDQAWLNFANLVDGAIEETGLFTNESLRDVISQVSDSNQGEELGRIADGIANDIKQHQMKKNSIETFEDWIKFFHLLSGVLSKYTHVKKMYPPPTCDEKPGDETRLG